MTARLRSLSFLLFLCLLVSGTELPAQQSLETLLHQLDGGEAANLDSAGFWIGELVYQHPYEDTILALGHRIRQRAEVADNHCVAAQALQAISLYYGSEGLEEPGRLDSAVRFGKLAITEWAAIERTSAMGVVNAYIADFLAARHRYAEAELYAFRALKLAQLPPQDSGLIVAAYSQLSNVAMARHDYAEVRARSRRMIELTPGSPPHFLGYAYLDIGYSHYYEGTLDSAVHYTQLSYDILKPEVAWGDSLLEYYALELLTVARYELDPNERTAQALSECVDLMRTTKSANYGAGQMFNLALIDLDRERYDAAIELLRVTETFCDSMPNYCLPDWHLMRLYNMFIRAYEGKEDYASALRYEQKLRNLSEGRLRQEIISLKAANAIEYESARKDARIREQTASLQQQTRIRRVYSYATVTAIVLAALSALGILLLVSQRRYLRDVNQELSVQNARNKTLVREVQHRVKNNLETIKSLLALQAASLQDPEARRRLLDSGNRVESMGMLHEQLYAKDSTADSVRLPAYCERLLRHVINAYDADDRIRLALDVQVETLPIDTALPLGLIINELGTNAMKHAFPDGASGVISLAVLPQDDGGVLLHFEDDGAGVPPEVAGSATGFGHQLIGMLTVQLGGRGDFYQNPAGGTGFRLRVLPIKHEN